MSRETDGVHVVTIVAIAFDLITALHEVVIIPHLRKAGYGKQQS